MDPEVGQIYTGKVVKVMDFGAFVNFFGAKDGLVHISQLAQNKVGQTSDVGPKGQEVKVKLMGFDDRGKTKLSMKVVDQETGEDLTEKLAAERAARGEEPETDEPRRERNFGGGGGGGGGGERGGRGRSGGGGGRDRERGPRRERTEEPAE
jgi:polyribonucleotide nucleotidyltransferase